MIGKAKFIGQGFKVTYSDLKDNHYTKSNQSIYVIQKKKNHDFFTPKDMAQKKLTYNYQVLHYCTSKISL